MSMNIGNIGASSAYTPMMHGAGHARRARPDTGEMVNNLFNQLDGTNKGYLEKSDLVSAYEKAQDTSSTASVDDVFSALDSDSDGKITKEEMTTGIQKLAEQLDSAFNAMRMSGMPPPPPPPQGKEKDGGLTKDEISAIASNTQDSQLAELMNNLAASFDEADSNGDGVVSVQEAMAFQAKQSSGSGTAVSTAADTTTSGTTSATGTDNTANVLRRILDLMRAYAPNTAEASTNPVSTLSATA
jgi:Ca2+-binding EF-hand superfamily protein